jgi:hypothetical protein
MDMAIKILDIKVDKFPLIIISDVHNNLLNVHRILLKHKGDQVICLGDVVDLFNENKTDENQRTIDFFSESDIPCLLGNHEQQLLACESGNSLLISSALHSPDYGLTQQHLNFLKSLPIGFKLILPDLINYYCFHNRPLDLWSFTVPPFDREQFRSSYPFDSYTQEIIIGHNHQNFLLSFPAILCKLRGIGALKLGDYAVLTETGIEVKKL